jgi:hypothetical protein
MINRLVQNYVGLNLNEQNLPYSYGESMVNNLSLSYKHVVKIKDMYIFGTSMTHWQLKKEN